MAARELPYEYYVELNGGEFCALCGRVPKPGENRLCRDHDHRSGRPRGLLCFLCNKNLPRRIDSAWLERARDYVARAENAVGP